MLMTADIEGLPVLKAKLCTTFRVMPEPRMEVNWKRGAVVVVQLTENLHDVSAYRQKF